MFSLALAVREIGPRGFLPTSWYEGIFCGAGGAARARTAP